MNNYDDVQICIIVNQTMDLVELGHDIATHINDDACYEGVHCNRNTDLSIKAALHRMTNEQLYNFENEIGELRFEEFCEN